MLFYRTLFTLLFESFTKSVQLTTSSTDFFVVAQMSVDLVGFVILVDVGCGLPRLKYVVKFFVIQQIKLSISKFDNQRGHLSLNIILNKAIIPAFFSHFEKTQDQILITQEKTQ